MFAIFVTIAIILPSDLAANNTTASRNSTFTTTAYSNETTVTTTTAEIYNGTELATTTSNVTLQDPVNQTLATTTVSITTSPETTVTQQTTQEISSTTPSITYPQTTYQSTSAAGVVRITDIVKQNWSAVVSSTNFTGTVLAGFNSTAFDETDFLEVVIEYFKTTNETALLISLQEHGIDEVAAAILDNVSDSLDQATRQLFSASGSTALYGFFASLHWMTDFVFSNNGERFDSLFNVYITDSSDSSRNASMTDFIQVMLSNASGSEMLKALCQEAGSAGVAEDVCNTQPTDTEKAVEKFTRYWEQILTYNFTNLDNSQKQELESITPENMTASLATYVAAEMPEDQIRNLLEANATGYVSGRLRDGSNSLSDTLGESALAILGSNETKQDLYYLYLIYMNGLTSSPENFQTVLDTYVETNTTATRRRKRATGCDRSNVNPDGLVCHIVAETGQNLTYLADTVCGEFEDSNACKSTFDAGDDGDTTAVTPVSSSVPIGVIVGAAIGGFCGLIILCALGYFIWRQCGKNQSKVNPEQHSLSQDHDVEMEESRRHGNGTAARQVSSSS